MTTKELTIRAEHIRESVIEMLLEAGSGHSAGPLGMADIFAVLYFDVLNIKPENPKWAERDRLVLSNGHICPVLYAAMAHRGFFEKEQLMTLRKLHSHLQGHPHNLELAGIENSSGPLGQGLSQAIGMALTAKMDNKKWHTFAMLSDGEHDEGQTWEAIMFAGSRALSNLTVVVDRNNIQIDGTTDHVMNLEPFIMKYMAFNWNVIEIDGNNIEEIVSAFKSAKAIINKPTVIIAKTIPGKGVKFIENDYEWHGKVPNEEQAQKALREIRTMSGKIKSLHE